MDLYTWLWIAWLVGAAGTFAAIEGPALLNRTPGDTLSEHIWRWIGVRGQSKRWTVWRVGLLLGLTWLTLHLVWGV